MTRLEMAVGQIIAAREYAQSYIEAILPEEWFRQPSEGVTHLAWQVGHLAVAEYSLALRRIRGEHPDDEKFISGEFRELFGRGSTPVADPHLYPEPTEIRLTLEAVHVKFLELTATMTDAQLDEPTEPHRFFNTKLGALLWCARHETYHVGQIALVRRLLGYAPRW